MLLLIVFRSILVTVEAAVMNLLSTLAAYGVMALVSRGGWFGELIDVHEASPVPSFIPMMMFAILFGLSMDYEVFLLSRVGGGIPAHGRQGRRCHHGVGLPRLRRRHQLSLKVIGIGTATAILVEARHRPPPPRPRDPGTARRPELVAPQLARRRRSAPRRRAATGSARPRSGRG